MSFDITTNYTTGATLVGLVMNGNTQIGVDYNLTESTNESGFYYSLNIDTSAYGTGRYSVLIKDFDSGDILGGVQQEFINNVTREDYDKTQSDAIEADTNELQTNQGNFATATGFSTPSDVTNAQTAIITEVDTNEGKIDTIITNVGNIPTNPLLTNDSRLNNLDATISSRSTLTAQNVWEYATRTVTSFGTLVSDIWSNVTRTVTGGTIDTNNDKTGYSLNESNLHTNLDNYSNKDNWKADISGIPTAAQIYAEFTSGSNEDVFKADVSSLATLAALTAAFTEIKGAGWTTTDTLEAIRNAVDTIDISGTINANIVSVTGTEVTDVDDFKGYGTITIATENVSEADLVVNSTNVVSGNCKKGILKQKYGEPTPLAFNLTNWLTDNSKLSSDIEFVNFIAKYNRKDTDETAVLNLTLANSITIDTVQNTINVVLEDSDYTSLKLGKTYEIGLAIQFTGESRPYELNLNNDRLQIIEDTIRANQLS